MCFLTLQCSVSCADQIFFFALNMTENNGFASERLERKYFLIRKKSGFFNATIFCNVSLILAKKNIARRVLFILHGRKFVKKRK